MLHNISIIYNDHQGFLDHDHQKVIDLCGTTKEGGTGLQNLRDCIQVIEIEYDQLSTYLSRLSQNTHPLSPLKMTNAQSHRHNERTMVHNGPLLFYY